VDEHTDRGPAGRSGTLRGIDHHEVGDGIGGEPPRLVYQAVESNLVIAQRAGPQRGRWAS
ncbi:MAG: hypothetical protein O7E50_09060, partial [Gemmatimonadetes bacterium]|nr:hypothetical protein [Gemmatimonadota bacterium]